jgi:hypothetical protein
MRALGVADGDDIGADLVMPRAAGLRPAQQPMAWTVTVAPAGAGQVLTVAALPGLAAYRCEPESMR